MKSIPLLAALVLALTGCAVAAPAAQAPHPMAPFLPSQAASSQCEVPGELAHWRADFCMASIGTDDIIAAGQCLEEESKVLFRSDCTGKLSYKRRMCEQAQAYSPNPRPVEACVADPDFVGPTVRNGGA